MNLINEPVEYGGTLSLNVYTKTLNLATCNRSNTYNTVDIPNGNIQWHTHPNKCSKTRCTLGIPSGDDLVGFANTAMHNNALAHLVYSADGVYAILMEPMFLRMMKHDVHFKKRFIKLGADNFNAFTHAFIENNNPENKHAYITFRNKWLNEINQAGFKVKLFPLNTSPVFVFNTIS